MKAVLYAGEGLDAPSTGLIDVVKPPPPEWWDARRRRYELRWYRSMKIEIPVYLPAGTLMPPGFDDVLATLARFALGQYGSAR